MSVRDVLMAAGGASAGSATYVDDVFSTWLYTGNGSTQQVTNGVDLTKGGLVWTKQRGQAQDHLLCDTIRGNTKYLSSNLTDAEGTSTNRITAFNTNGYTLGSGAINGSTNTFASWTFRKQPKFFDVVTYTGDGNEDGQNIPHSLGSVPGCIIVKRIGSDGNWQVWHRSIGFQNLRLNSTGSTGGSYVSQPTSTTFPVYNSAQGSDPFSYCNIIGVTYVAYIFAHNAGGFGELGTENIISCGSYTGTAGTTTVNLGFEPQWLMIKSSSNGSDWRIVDTMRGFVAGPEASIQSTHLAANTANGEATNSTLYATPTGFTVNNYSAEGGDGRTYIYIAIRRPHKPPTSGTSVFAPVTYTGNGTSSRIITTGITTDLIIGGDRGNNGVGVGYVSDRLRGQAALNTFDTTSELVNSVLPKFDLMNGYNNNGATGGAYNASSFNYVRWAFRRAPGFFDQVCYTGNGTTQNVNHNLGVIPEMLIVRRRDSVGAWGVYHSALGNNTIISIQSTDAAITPAPQWNTTTPTSTVFSLGTSGTGNTSGGAYVAYLFASLPGVSKVGSYTGNGSSQTINCGFTNGARFFLVKRTDSTGDWWVYDSARGIVSAADPALRLNSTAAEVTSADAVDPQSSGLIVNQESTCNINVNGATYIYLAIA